MTTYVLTAPSKTFLIGEYVALAGGPTIILNTLPRFNLTATTTTTPFTLENNGINPHSPAGKYWQLNQQSFSSLQLSFQDPHKGIGGFGASSAQFALLFLLQKLLQHSATEKTITLNISELLSTYKKCAWSGQGFAPSGADVIAQCRGGITFYDYNNSNLQQWFWPFKDLDFCLLRTGHKMATHQHLTNLANIDTTELSAIAVQTQESLVVKDSRLFLESIKQFQAILAKLHLITDHTQTLLAKLSANSDILAAKGCGALGADVIIFFYYPTQWEPIQSWLKQQQFDIYLNGHQSISQGIECGLNIKFNF